MTPDATSYAVITPVRDEEEHLVSTLDSMIAQTVLPRAWIIVDDGSTDRTPQILDDYAGRYPWITVVRRADRGFRKSGGGVVEAFNYGLSTLQADWDFLVKFDGDLTFEPTYFESCLREFAADGRLGIGGGVICYVENGEKSFEEAPAFHVRGATKIYRKACWEAIGGLMQAPGWDTFDEVKANSCGWTTRSFPDLHLVHQRETGAADGAWRSLVKYGRANYICGYLPLFMLLKCVKRLARRPYFLGSLGLMAGYVGAYLTGVPQVDDPAAVRYLRRQQLNRLCGRETIWR